MSVNERVQALKDKHAALDAAIAEEMVRAYPNNLMIKDMKVQKLAIKEEMERLTSH